MRCPALFAALLSLRTLVSGALTGKEGDEQQDSGLGARAESADKTGLSLTARFVYNKEQWELYEDLSRPGGTLRFVSGSGVTKVLGGGHVEAAGLHNSTQHQATVPLYLGLDPAKVNMALKDILAEELLKDGEPVEYTVRDVFGGSSYVYDGLNDGGAALLGTVEANDTMLLDTHSRTQNRRQDALSYYDLGNSLPYFYEAHVDNWKPGARQMNRDSPEGKTWMDSIAFADVDNADHSRVRVRFRDSLVSEGETRSTNFTFDMPAFPPARVPPTADAFYAALLRFADYWEKHLSDFADLTLPDPSWADITKYIFAQELVTRYGGAHLKYGAWDRAYAGNEYDAFQPVLTSSVLANLGWGRFEQARKVMDNYLTQFTSDTGDILMRGPEMPQFGLSLSLLARYVQYTNDSAMLEKHRTKILAWVNIITTRHDQSLALNPADPGYGLVHGWHESDASRRPNPEHWTQPYWSNNALSARGLLDLSKLAIFADKATDWRQRSDKMRKQIVQTLTSSIRLHQTPPYVPVLPARNLTVMESITQDDPKNPTSLERWPHRVYSDLLQSAILPRNLTAMVIDSMRAYGLTTAGLPNNAVPLDPKSRQILGFASYGYALALLLHDRIDEFVLYLYMHRYQVHTRGIWLPREVMSTDMSDDYLCQPASHSLAIILRAALVFEHPDDDDVLLLGRGIPRAWLATARPTSIAAAPTRWGPVHLSIRSDPAARTVTANISFGRDVPAETRLKLRAPSGHILRRAAVDAAPDAVVENEEVVLRLGNGAKTVTVVGSY